MRSSELISNPREQQAVRTWLELMRCAKTLETRLGSNLRRNFSQSFSRFDVLSQLYRAGNMTLPVTILASQLLTSSSRNITGLIDRMEKDGLVLRSPHPEDRRSFVVQLTQAGIRLFEEMAVEHGHWVSDGFDGLSSSELRSMQKTMIVLRRHLEDGKSD